MDDRTLEAAEATTERQRQQAIANNRKAADYTILVLGKLDGPFMIKATGAEDRMEQMRARGIDPSRDRWAAAQHSGRSYSICGNNALAKQQLDQHLRMKR